MLDNEPNATQTQDTAAPTQAKAKRTRKRTAKKTAPEIAPVEAQPTEAQPAEAPAAKKTAKKAAAKRPAKKAAAATEEAVTVSDNATSKRSRRRKAAEPAPEPAPEPVAQAGEQPAKKTTRKRSSKKSAAQLTAIDPAAVDAASAPAPVEPAPARGAPTAAVLFQPPVEPVEPPRRRAKKAEAVAEDTETAPPAGRRTRKSAAKKAAAEPVEAEVTAGTETDEQAETEDDGDGDGTRRRRRRRGGRRRRKAGEGEADGDDEPTAEDETDQADQAEDTESDGDDDGEGSGTTRRRRRRRRRKGEDSATAPDDPDETVVRVREPRSKSSNSEITAVEGSTRLEAKKQRRREGRAAGRRRTPIVSEAEFLARRESVERTMVIRARDDLTQIAVSEDNVLVEHYVAQAEQTSLIGNVYLGRVQNVLPSMEAAFIDIGKGRNAVLYAGEVDWATLGASNGHRKIESVLKSGQAVLVQVTKDPSGHKGARLTNQISLPGRYVVYVPRGGNGGISRKLPDTERNRLKGILKDIVPDEAGVIVRTAAEGASEEELTRDVSRLKSYWEEIDKKSGSGQAPQMLYGEPDLLIRVVRDLFTEDFNKLVISGDPAYDLVHEYVSYVAPHLADRVQKWTGDGDVFAAHRIDEQIKKALDRKVWLPSGGSLVIDRTEAMTVVDVNTGKFTGSGGNLEETVTRNNLEAAEEMVRQLRLRDIGGIIVVDFIDMVLESNRELVLRRLVECLGRDRTKHQVAEVTSLGLVQMTRKRIGTGLLEAFSETCEPCGGRGLLLHDEPREARRNKQQQQGDESGKSGKSSRRSRGRKAKQEPAEEQPSDAAQRLAEIAAATVAKDIEDATDDTGSESASESASESEELVVAPV